MGYCEGKSQASVAIKKANFQEKVTSRNPPIEVSLIRGGGVSIDVSGIADNGGPVPESGTFAYPGGSPGDSYSIIFENCSVAIGCGANSPVDGRSFSQVRFTRNGQYEGVYIPVTGWHSCKIDRVNVAENCTIIIKEIDSNQAIYRQSFNGSCPQFQVSCDDECPPDHLRCPTTKYPGYCCIPCKPTAAEIAAIKEQVRRFNRG